LDDLEGEDVRESFDSGLGVGSPVRYSVRVDGIVTGGIIGTVVGDPISVTGDFDVENGVDGEDRTDGDDGVDGIVAGDPRGAVVGAFVKDDVGFVAGVAEPTTGDCVGPVVNVFVDPRERNAVSILP
jgi:hypothetical protein